MNKKIDQRILNETEIEIFSVLVPKGFSPFVEAALIRLGYLYPDFDFENKSSRIEYFTRKSTSFDPREVKKNILHQLYRERIYSETLPIRNWFYENE